MLHQILNISYFDGKKGRRNPSPEAILRSQRLKATKDECDFESDKRNEKVCVLLRVRRGLGSTSPTTASMPCANQNQCSNNVRARRAGLQRTLGAQQRRVLEFNPSDATAGTGHAREQVLLVECRVRGILLFLGFYW